MSEPELRFKEFIGEWELKKLGEVISFIPGYAFKSLEMVNKGKYQLIKMSNVYQNELRLDRNPSFWKDINNKTEKFLLEKGDVVLTLTGTVGKKDYGYSIEIPENDKFLLNQRLVALKKKEGQSSPKFINSLVKTSRFYYSFFNESKGGTGNQTNVGVQDLRNIKLLIPSLPEQQKIASFLGAVDKRIELLTKKKDLLETYKKGVMQKLFSQEIRFKPDLSDVEGDENGNDYPYWEEKKLGDVGKTINGLTYSPNDIASDGVLVLRSSNIKKGRLDFNDNVYVRTSNYNPVQKGDILICVRNGSKRLIGKNCMITKQAENMAFGAFMSVFRSEYNPYLFHWFNYKDFKKNVHRNLGATINSINNNELKSFSIPFPSLKEQQKIANFLEAIDQKIEQTTQQLDGTKTFKKGLLQKMFV